MVRAARRLETGRTDARCPGDRERPPHAARAQWRAPGQTGPRRDAAAARVRPRREPDDERQERLPGHADHGGDRRRHAGDGLGHQLRGPRGQGRVRRREGLVGEHRGARLRQDVQDHRGRRGRRRQDGTSTPAPSPPSSRRTSPCRTCGPTSATLLDGGTFGVGQPIVVWFDEPFDEPGRGRAQPHRHDRPAGRRGRLALDERPRGALAARRSTGRPAPRSPSRRRSTASTSATACTGQEDRKASFTIGQSKIAVADSNTKRMKVYIDGKQVTHDQRQRRHQRHPDQHGQGRHRERAPTARSSTSGPTAARTW